MIDLSATDVIDSDAAGVRETAARLCAGRQTEEERAQALFEFVRDAIAYNFAPDLASRADWKASLSLERGDGFCQQKSVLLAALARAAGIPSRVCLQHIRDFMLTERYTALLGGNELPYHGLTSICLNGRWQRLDATLDRALVERRGYRLVEFVAGVDCVLPATNLAGAPHFAVSKDLGCFADLPQEVSSGFLTWATLQGPEWKGLVRRTRGSM